MFSSKHEKDNRSLVQTVVALLAKLWEIEILKKYLFDTYENINNTIALILALYDIISLLQSIIS